MEPRKALIVEDSPAMRQLLVSALGVLGHISADEAGDGVEALKKLETGRYDILLVDINIPLLDGLKLVERVRHDSNHADVPILIITTEAAAEDRARALTLGANDYLTKPVRAQEVRDAVQRLLGGTGAR